jgi:ribosomal protein S18 acetylase RimI-like enzyme
LTAFEFGAVTADDFEELVALRIAVMRESLERIGRFDLVRSRERFRSTFRPADTRRIIVAGARAGCVAMWREPPDAMRIEHFYIAVAHQGHGLGSAVLRCLLKDAPADVKLFRVGALRDSDANRFYQRHGFAKAAESEWDIDYERDSERPLSIAFG